MKYPLKLATVALSSMFIMACGSSDDSNDTSANTPSNTGTNTDNQEERVLVSASEISGYDYQTVTGIDAYTDYAYFDLDTGTQLDLDNEAAQKNTQWDIAFSGTSIILNGDYSGPGAVSANYTGNNVDFRDDSGSAVVDKFTAATPESELQDFLAITEYDASTKFSSDEFTTVFGGDYYNYDHTTHIVSANDEQVYLLQNELGFYKIKVSDLTTVGFSLSSVTFAYEFKGNDDQTFATENQIEVNMSSCTEDAYISLDANDQVTDQDQHEIILTCNGTADEQGTGAQFDILLANASAYALQAESNLDSIMEYPQYYLTEDYASTVFKHQHKWYEYNLAEQNQIWSQYGVYLVKTSDATYKFQVTGYYNLVDEVLLSRQISFIYQSVSESESTE